MIWLVGFMVFNTTFNNISVISWRLLLLKGSKKKKDWEEYYEYYGK